MPFMTWALFWARGTAMSKTNESPAPRASDSVRRAQQSPWDGIPGRPSGPCPPHSGPATHTCCPLPPASRAQILSHLPLLPMTNSRTSPATPQLREVLQKGAVPGTLLARVRVLWPHPSLCFRTAGVFWNDLALPVRLLAFSGMDQVFSFLCPYLTLLKLLHWVDFQYEIVDLISKY